MLLTAILPKEYMRIVAYFMLAMCVIGIAQMYIDKRRAVNGKRRIRESVLLITAVLGGSAGSLIGMLLFHHKTNARRHPAFVFGIPVMLLAQVLIIWLLFVRNA